MRVSCIASTGRLKMNNVEELIKALSFERAGKILIYPPQECMTNPDENNMTEIFSPSNIEILLHCHVRVEPHPRLEAPAVRDAILAFLKIGAIAPDPECQDLYHTTPLGKAWVEALCRVPPPWIAFIDQQGKLLNTMPYVHDGVQIMPTKPTSK